MASVRSSSLLSSTKSGRVLPNSSRSLLMPSASNHVRSTGLPPAGPAGHAPSPILMSNVSLFLTSLRLLDLDLVPDWPDINLLTFTTKDIAQGQKKRIQCVEWALYQLFNFWDEEETRNKLQPFFPPHDHVQSLNLRAALLRFLEHAKKMGVLGRDAVVRKTMLDECKGERLEEVLAVFSSAVLKKLVAEAQLTSREHPAIAQVLALEPRGYAGDTAQLTALVLAHRVALSRLLRDKNKARARYNDLAQLLYLKKRNIARRREILRGIEQVPGRSELSEQEKLVLWQTVRDNWSGNARWMETLLHGDENSYKDGLLTSPFDRVWRRVQSGRLSELEHKGPGLLAQLDSRVKAQNDRLQKWNEFRKSMFGTSSTLQDRDDREKSLGCQRGIELGFGPHENLPPGRMSPRKLAARPLPLEPEYASLLDGLRQELGRINRGAPNPFAGGLRASAAVSKTSADSLGVAKPAEESVSELSELEEELERAIVVPEVAKVKSRPYGPTVKQDGPRDDAVVQDAAPQRRSRLLLRLDASTTVRGSASTGNNKTKPTSVSPTRRCSIPSPGGPGSPVSSPTAPPRTPSPARQQRPETQPLAHVRLPQPPELVVSQTQQMADQILASMNATSPSPEKKKPRHTLSLAERTRLSMARGSRLGPLEGDDEEDGPDDVTSMPLQRRGTANGRKPPKPAVVQGTREEARMDKAAEDADEDDEKGAPAEDLVTRTRRSMVNFEATRQRAQIERRRSERKAARQSSIHSQQQQHRRHGSSLMPTTLEDLGEGDSMLVEEMLEQGVDDYEAVFMSRPKIKTSPAISPTRNLDEPVGRASLT